MTKTTPYYTLLDHTADLGFTTQGNNLIELFTNAAKAFMHIMLMGTTLKKTDSVTIPISGNDLEDLMVRWLGEILYLFEGENLVVNDVYIDTFLDFQFEATLKTVPFDPQIHEILREIKAVTYHRIKVAETNGLWEALVVLDL